MAIFPKEILESTSEYYLDKIKVRSKIIYIILIAVFIGGLTALPYLYINLSIKSRGVLTPKSARVMLYAPVTGPVIYKAISENQLLSKGDTICVIDTELLDTQIEFNKRLKKENEQYLNDLQKIAKTNFTRSFNIHTLTTAVYRSAASEVSPEVYKVVRMYFSNL